MVYCGCVIITVTPSMRRLFHLISLHPDMGYIGISAVPIKKPIGNCRTIELYSGSKKRKHNNENIDSTKKVKK